MQVQEYQGFEGKKSFWRRPEGITGLLFLGALVLGGGYLLYTFLPLLIALASNLLYLSGMLIVLAGVLYMVLDPKMRNLIAYAYQSLMRGITGIFININPIAILKNYVEDLEKNLLKMSKQIGNLRGQTRQLQGLVEQNKKEIAQQLSLAAQAQQQQQQNQVVLATRKAARLQDANEKYDVLLSKMDVLYKILTRMYESSETLIEDTRSQVSLKEQEYKAIQAGYSAMQQAASVLKGDANKKRMFEMSMEAINNDVATKVGEMERFMEMSGKFMDSIDLQNGVFEDEGLRLLEEWDQKGLLLKTLPKQQDAPLELRTPTASPEALPASKSTGNQYDRYFE